MTTSTHAALIAEIAVPLPIDGTFTYLLPENLAARAIPGVRVRVPFRNREMIGYLVSVGDLGNSRHCEERSDEAIPAQRLPRLPAGQAGRPSGAPRNDGKGPLSRIKPLLDILDDAPVVSPGILELTRWIGEYYGCSWGEAIENALPKWVKYGKKAEKYLERRGDASAKRRGETRLQSAVRTDLAALCSGRGALEGKSHASKKTEGEACLAPADTPRTDFTLTPEQRHAFDLMSAALKLPKKNPVLLFGVTGSGKSELYIRMIHEVLKAGKSAICLVPEIALTEQIRLFFHHHFGTDLEILHSKLSDGERFLAWKRIEAGQCRVVLGPRSAVFAPVPDLGVIILDEEHENSYKQETAPRYHAREVARWRAAHENALFIMGSATPSMETMYAAGKGQVTRIDLLKRVDERPLPRVEILDLRAALGGQRRMLILTPKLSQEIEQNLKRREGTLLLLNRRGFSTRIHCSKCGTTESCTACQVSLTFHQEDNTLLCHYCNLKKAVPDECSQCGAPVLRFAGFGTEKVESEVAARFPAARIARMDADTVRKKGSHEVILKDFREQKLDILIGTQMIAKGFDFPHVTLVGVILADVGLMLPDFRSAERTFQLLTQVAGRAGRGKIPGRVYIQTFSPDHPSIQCAQDHDYHRFYTQEAPERLQYAYPPCRRLINTIIRSRDEKAAYQFAREARDAIRKEFDLAPHNPENASMHIVGPAPLPFYRLRGHFRWHVMLKVTPETQCMTRLRQVLNSLKKPAAVAFAIDVDPLNIL